MIQGRVLSNGISNYENLLVDFKAELSFGKTMQYLQEVVKSGNSHEIITRSREESSFDCTPTSDLTESSEN